MWRNGKLEAEDFPLEQLSDYLEQDDCLVWADLCAPDAARLDELAHELHLDRHAVEDAIADNERPKATRYADHVFLTAYALVAGETPGKLTTARVSAFGLSRGLITVQLDETFDIDAVVRRWDDSADLIKYGTRTLMHGLLDEVVDGYFDAIESLDDEIEDIEDVLFQEDARSTKELHRRTFELRKALTTARRAILPMREVVNTMMRSALENDHGGELAPYYEDLYDHTLRAAEWTESLRDMITSIFETNLSLADVRMNAIMKKLTGWAAIIAVPTAITGYFGMNVPYPFFGQHGGVVLSATIIAVTAGGLYLLFKRKDWI